jgi:O-acetyl-ADP-ribose deacetylase (regulator of RNase III)
MDLFQQLHVTSRQELRDLLTTITEELEEPILEKIDQLLLSERFLIPGIPTLENEQQLQIFKGDMTQLECDAYVNPANNGGLGCFQKDHKCLDNILHAKAGPRLRIACRKILQGRILPTGNCISTPGFCLHCKYVIHTVGPSAANNEPLNWNLFAKAYLSSLEEAVKLGCKSIAFPCISTGIFKYPKREAATMAKTLVEQWQEKRKRRGEFIPLVIFCVFTKEDEEAYNL